MRKRMVIIATGLMLFFSGCGDLSEMENSIKETEVTVNESESTEQSDLKKKSELTQQPNLEKESGITEENDFKEQSVEVESLQETIMQEETSSQELFQAWDECFESVFLEEVTAALNRENAVYTAQYNRSGERIDMELEDGTTLLFLKVTDSDMNDLGYKLIMKDGVLDGNSFQEQYLNAYDVIRFDYYAPELSEKLIDEEWLQGLNQTDCSMIRNELYAKYGRQFSDPFLKAVFELKDWYNPIYPAKEFDAMGQDFLTKTEKENLARIMEYEVNAGYRKKSGNTSKTVRPFVSGSWFDLDGNGIKEQIFYEMEEMTEYGDFVAASVSVVLKGSTEGEKENRATIKLEACNLHENAYVFSMDGKKQYLVMADYGPSSDNEMFIYEYAAGKLEKVGRICDDPNAVKVYADRIEASERYDHICSQYITFTYVLENGNFEKTKKDFYEYFNYEELVTCQDILLYKDKDSESNTIAVQSGEKLEMLGGDLEEWILFKRAKTGEEGWLYVKSGKCMIPDGSMVYAGQVIEGLAFFD